MKHKTRPIRDLFYRFIENSDFKINSQELAAVLAKQGLIELVPHKDKPVFEHYRDTELMEQTSVEHFWDLLRDGIERHT